MPSVDVNDAISVSEFMDVNLIGPPLNLVYSATETVQTVYVETFGETRIKVETET